MRKDQLRFLRFMALGSTCGGLAMLAAAPAVAADPTTAGTANIGTTGFNLLPGFWKTGVPAATGYSVATDGHDTFINAPAANGEIHFRAANVGPIITNPPITYPDSVTIEASGEVDVVSGGAYALQGMVYGDGGIGVQGQGNLAGIKGFAHQAGGYGVWGYALDNAKIGVYGLGAAGSGTTWGAGVYGLANGAWPTAGVYGENDTSGGVAMVAIAGNATSGMGVFGQGATTGVQGCALGGVNGSTIPWGVSGVANGSGGHAIDAICNGACATSAGNATNPGVAGHFAGNVLIDGTNASGSPYALKITLGDASKPGGGMWQTTSDERVKKDVETFAPGLAELQRVRPVVYRYNGLGGTHDDGRQYFGVIAQELEKVMPAMVTSQKAKLRPSDARETDVKQVDPTAFTYMLINAVNAQERVIQRLEDRVATMERERAPLASSMLSGNLGTLAAFGLVPLGLVLARRNRRKDVR